MSRTRFSFSDTFRPAFAALTRYMARAGLIAFADDPTAPAAPSLLADPPATPPTDGATPPAEGQGTTPPAEGATPPADGQKPADGEGEKKPDDQKPQPKAPEKYEFQAPEGFALDEQLQGEFDPVLRELDLTNEQAQKLVDFAPKLIGKSVDAAVGKVLEQIGYADAPTWAATAKADKEYGGDKLTESLAVARQARDQFATPELRKLLDSTPLGSHPEMVRLFVRVGKAISPDGYVPGGKTSGATNDARRLYDNSQMNP